RSAEHERPCAGPARGTTGRRVAPHPPQRASGHAPGHRRQPVMKRIVGILLIVLILYALILSSRREARTLGNHQKLAQRLALFGVLTVGAGTLIIAGGIDLSIGSVFCLAGVALGLLLNGRPEGTSATFLVLTIVTASGCVAAVAYPPLRDRYGRLLAAVLAPLAGVVAPVTLAVLLFGHLASRVPAIATRTLLAVLGGVSVYLVPLLIAWGLKGRPDLLGVLTVLIGTGLIGLFHGLLITRLRLQPFIV